MINEASSHPAGMALPFRLKERLLETLADTAGIGIVLIAGNSDLLYINSVARELWSPSGICPTLSCAADLWRQILTRAADPETFLERVENIGMNSEDCAEFRFKFSSDSYVTVQTAPCDTGESGIGRLWTFRQTERRATGPSATIARLTELLGSIIQAGFVAGEGLDLALSAERYRNDVERYAHQALTLVQQISRTGAR